MDLNSLFFGIISVGSLAIFFYLGRFKASRKQLEREDRIEWTTRKFSFWKIFIYSVAVVSVLVLIEYLFGEESILNDLQRNLVKEILWKIFLYYCMELLLD